jgi:osmotically-inducible protein OsmY
MKTDSQIKSDVMSEIAWEPTVHSDHIGVTVRDGVVTLTGHLENLADKHAVERATRRVSGVRAIAVELDVVPAAEHRRGDSDIARAALTALRWHSWVPEERVRAEVEDGWVTLSGEVDWRYQATSAEQSIRPLVRVRGVTNDIAIKPRVSGQDISEEINAALTRHAQREASHIGIEVDGGVVTLTGEVHSLPEHDAALGAAWATRGVSRVVDKLRIET